MKPELEKQIKELEHKGLIRASTTSWASLVLLVKKKNGTYRMCVDYRKLNEKTAELKRMYVKPAYRGYRLGAEILQRSLEMAKELGYEKIRLDTLDSMAKAIALYKSSGFYQIPAYRFNPLEGTVYMEKEL